MEKDLFNPIKEYFVKQGYTCDGEVADIDLYMEKGGESIAVELKQTLDFKSVQQAALRQKVTDHVYIGIFKPSDMNSSSFRDKLYILKRLGIGLIVVGKRIKRVNVISEPVVSELSAYQKRNAGKKKRISKEFNARKAKNNIGGVHATKLITSYREDALLVLDALLELGGEGKCRQIREISKIDRTSLILRNNYYDWFDKVESGLYKISDKGLEAAEEFEETMYILKKGAEK